MTAKRQKYWQKLQGHQLLRLIIAVSAMAIAYEGMSQGVMGAMNVAPEYGVRTCWPGISSYDADLA